MFKIRVIAIGIIIGSLFAWRDAPYERIHSLLHFPAVAQWAITLAIFWALGIIISSLLWPTAERVLTFLAVTTFPNLFPNSRIVVVDDTKDTPTPKGVWAKTEAPGDSQDQEKS